MRPLERRPGNDPGFPDCAAWVCPLHSARVDGLACPGTPIGSRRRNTGGSGRAESDRPSGGMREPSAPPAKCPKDRHVLAPDNTPPGRTTDPEAMNFVPRRFSRGLGCR